MFIRRWIIAVALGLVLSTSLKAQDEAQSVEDGASGQQQPTLVLPITIPVQIIEDDERASSRERREAESEQREKDALIAQQSMKKAAWWSFVAVSIGSVLLVGTLYFSWKAVGVTRRIGQAQTRSYLYLSFIDGEIVKGVIKGTVRIKNSGTSPALLVKQTLLCNHSKTGFEDRWLVSPSLGDFGHLHSQGNLEFSFNTLDEDVPATAVSQGHVSFWVFGRVEYVDVFDQKWRLDYRHRFNPNGRYRFNPCAEGNSLNKIE
jgi:hypothetical protein